MSLLELFLYPVIATFVIGLVVIGANSIAKIIPISVAALAFFGASICVGFGLSFFLLGIPGEPTTTMRVSGFQESCTRLFARQSHTFCKIKLENGQTVSLWWHGQTAPNYRGLVEINQKTGKYSGATTNVLLGAISE